MAGKPFKMAVSKITIAFKILKLNHVIQFVISKSTVRFRQLAPVRIP